MATRILVSFLLLMSILFLPLWLSAIIAISAMVIYSFFFEAVLLFLLSDLLYGVKEDRYLGILFVSTIFSIILLLLIELVKKLIRFYPKKNDY